MAVLQAPPSEAKIRKVREGLSQTLAAHPEARFAAVVLQPGANGEIDTRIHAAMAPAEMLEAAAFLIEIVAGHLPTAITDLEAQRLAERLVPVLRAMDLLPEHQPEQRMHS